MQYLASIWDKIDSVALVNQVVSYLPGLIASGIAAAGVLAAFFLGFVLPNKLMAQQRIINYALLPRIRVRVPLGIAYKEDIRSAREVILNTLAGDPQVIVTSLGPSSPNLELRFWLEDPILQWAKQWEYLEKCKYALDGAAIQIPYPHLQMFLERTDTLQQLTDAIGRA